MKRHAFLAVALSLVCVLTGCSAGGASARDAADEQATTTMANPWTSAESGEEAGKGAFDDVFAVPEDLALGDIEWKAPKFSYMEGIAEANYDGGAVEAWVRKGSGVSGSDLHGVYNEFEVSWTTDVDGVQVSCSGHEEGVANLLEWNVGNYGYTAYVIGLGGENYGVDAADVAGLVGSIK